MNGTKFIVKALDDRSVDEYDSLEQVYMNCEGIDVNNDLYEFRDQEGNDYAVEWIENQRSRDGFLEYVPVLKAVID